MCDEWGRGTKALRQKHHDPDHVEQGPAADSPTLHRLAGIQPSDASEAADPNEID